jgi:hypothetical protein
LLVLDDAGHFVQERGERIAQVALEYFRLGRLPADARG